MSFRNAFLGATALTTLGALSAYADGHAKELTIAIVNNGHMINMQKVAEAYTEETGVTLNWVALEEGVLRTVPDANLGAIFGWGYAPFHGGPTPVTAYISCPVQAIPAPSASLPIVGYAQHHHHRAATPDPLQGNQI